MHVHRGFLLFVAVFFLGALALAARPADGAPLAAATGTRAPTGAPKSPTPTPTITPTRSTLSLRPTPFQNDYVKKLQERLIRLGYGEVGVASGVFDAQTDAAVRHFQWLNQLAVDGVVDDALWGLLFSDEAVAYYLPPAYPGHILSKNATLPLCDDHMLHDRLAMLGYLSTDSKEFRDGVFGADTDAAVKKFQTVHRLKADGAVTLEVWERLWSPLAVSFDAAVSPTPLPAKMPWTTSIYALGAAPLDIAWDGTRLWALLEGDMALFVDPASGRVSAPIRLGACPVDYENPISGAQHILFAKQRIWVNFSRPSGATQGIEISNANTLTPFILDVEGYSDMVSAFGFDGSALWVTGGDDQARAVDPATRKVFTARTVGWLGAGKMVYDGKCMWVARDDGGLVTAFDTGTYQCTKKGDHMLPAGPLAFDGQRLWSAFGDLWWLDTKTGGLSEGGIPAGSDPAALVYDGKRLWVANRGDDAIQSVEVKTGQLGSPIPVGDEPGALLVEGKRLWVANAGSHTVQSIETGKLIFPTPLPPSPTPTRTLQPTATRTPTSKPGTPTPTPPPFSRSLYLTTPHMFGEDVLALQIQLIALGYTQIGAADGDFGAKTDAAVRAFQTDHALTVDGVVGRMTWAAIFNSAAGPVTPPPTPTSEFTVSNAYLNGLDDAGLVYDGENLWVLNSGLRVFDVSKGTTGKQSIDVGEAPCYSKKTFWGLVEIAGSGPGSVLTVEGFYLASRHAQTGEQQYFYLTEGGIFTPFGALACEEDVIWVGNYDGWVLGVDVDGSSNPMAPKITRRIYVNGPVKALRVVDDNLWVSYGGEWSEEAGLAVYDPATGKLLNWYAVSPAALAYGGGRLWMAFDEADSVQYFDVDKNQWGALIPVGDGPAALAYDGKWLWVVNLGERTLRYVVVKK